MSIDKVSKGSECVSVDGYGHGCRVSLSSPSPAKSADPPIPHPLALVSFSPTLPFGKTISAVCVVVDAVFVGRSLWTIWSNSQNGGPTHH